MPLLLLALACPAPVLAAPKAEPPQSVDLLEHARRLPAVPPETEPCEAEQDTAAIAGEIVVCRRVSDGAEHRLRNPGEARSRYAAATMDAGDPRAPDLEPKYSGVVVSRGCFIPPCPKSRAIVIDFAALPETPPGSDAERIANGLTPVGEEENSPAAQARIAARLAAERELSAPAPATDRPAPP
ncbi:hypothetical protein [Porphyrobacter sp. GA68]|uniref:hypothetical protein n=1 Tax=Porphyrobacter sp. GA68 TaxID=2883480 RepID=UPI001D198768|nr:hypothetical protein [Porphyrobacter sp. GA68]